MLVQVLDKKKGDSCFLMLRKVLAARIIIMSTYKMWLIKNLSLKVIQRIRKVDLDRRRKLKANQVKNSNKQQVVVGSSRNESTKKKSAMEKYHYLAVTKDSPRVMI